MAALVENKSSLSYICYERIGRVSAKEGMNKWAWKVCINHEETTRRIFGDSSHPLIKIYCTF